MKLRAWLAIALSLPVAAEARVFDFKSEVFAAYVGGSFGNSNVSDTAYAKSSGRETRFDKKVLSTSSGEIGFVIALEKFNLRLGADYLMPRELIGVVGTDANTTELFALTSRISALVPMANLEMLIHKSTTSKSFLGLGYGMAFVTLDNIYTMTADGTSAFGVGDYTESAKATAPMLQAYLGWEFLFTDTVTATIQGGYRRLVVTDFKTTKAATTIHGDQTENGDVYNYDGTKRTLDLGGGFVGINFRFYLGR